MTNNAELYQALLRSNPRLSRFDPLDRIIFHDDFDEGLNGWTLVAGNYEDSFDFDLATMTMTRLRCNDREYDLRGLGTIEIPAMPNLWCMMQPLAYVSADTDKRAFMYIDSAMLSAEAL